MSGKSVYLKQVGLIVYLAHIGSFVPCERAIIGLTDKILTRINSVETGTTTQKDIKLTNPNFTPTKVSSSQSSFALDLTQTSRILSSHTDRSLCLLDEFGKGTTPIDGIALLAATVKHFVKHKGKAMFVLHFTEIIHDLILHEKDMMAIQCFRMETHSPHPRGTKTEKEWSSDDDGLNLNSTQHRLCISYTITNPFAIITIFQIRRKRPRCTSCV